MQMLAMAFPLLAVLIWTGNTIVAKLAVRDIEPAAISFYRLLIAGVVMTPFLLLRAVEKPSSGQALSSGIGTAWHGALSGFYSPGNN